MVGLHSFEVVAELLPGDLTVVVAVVSVPEELFDVAVTHFGVDS